MLTLPPSAEWATCLSNTRPRFLKPPNLRIAMIANQTNKEPSLNHYLPLYFREMARHWESTRVEWFVRKTPPSSRYFTGTLGGRLRPRQKRHRHLAEAVMGPLSVNRPR